MSTTVIRLLALLTAMWAILTLLDISHRSESGYATDGNNTVVHLAPGGAAEAAGLLVGDYIEAVNGVSSMDAAGLARLGRAEVGELRVLSIRRGGAFISVDLVPGPLGARSRNLAWLGWLAGAVFLARCVHEFLRQPIRATRVLAVMGIGFSLVFFDGTRFDWPFFQSLLAVMRSALVLAAFAAMLHFLLVFPRAGPFAAQARNIRVIYLPAALFWLLLSYRTMFQAQASTALNTLTYILTGLVIASYCLFSLIVFLRKYLKTPGPERHSSGMNLMLWGSLLGFGPAMLAYMPAFSGVAGHEYLLISLVLVPLSWCHAVRRASG